MSNEKTWVHWQGCEDGTYILYEGDEEIFRADNEECMTCLVDFAKSKYYSHIISMNAGVSVYSVDGDLMERQTPPYYNAWKIKENT